MPLPVLALALTSRLRVEAIASLPPSAPLATTAQISLGFCATGRIQVCCPCQHGGHSAVKRFGNAFVIKQNDGAFHCTQSSGLLGEEAQSVIGRRGGTSAAFPKCSQHPESHLITKKKTNPTTQPPFVRSVLHLPRTERVGPF